MPGQDFIRTLARDALLERLQPIVVEARTVIDFGRGRASDKRALKRRFRGARVVSVDVKGETCAIPFDDGAIDVVVANLFLPGVIDPGRLFTEVARALRKDGLFAFSTFGPDTLPELGFPDMHDVGDAAVRAGLRDPVLDVDRSTLSYENFDLLEKDLADLGLRAGAGMQDSPASLELELVYGHCWGPGPAAKDGGIRIDPAQITRR